MKAPPQVKVANYSACFLDLLGQKQAMEGQSILPETHTPEQYQELIHLVKSSVGKIVSIQKHAESMLVAMEGSRAPPGPLDEVQLKLWKQMREYNTVTQRWSDGLMVFTCLGDTLITTQLNSLYAQLTLAGAMCLIGLAAKAPIRAGIDIAWGVELHPGELYGPAVANAYILESETAEFPRVVVGNQVESYLNSVINDPDSDIFSKAARCMATTCRSMLSRDNQGQLFLDYLSTAFERVVTSSHIDELWPHARAFIRSQLDMHATTGNDKLHSRYQRLARYFDSNLPPSLRNSEAHL